MRPSSSLGIEELRARLALAEQTIAALDEWIRRQLEPAIRQQWHPNRYGQILSAYKSFLQDPRFEDIGPQMHND